MSVSEVFREAIDNSQVSDVPSVDERLDDETVIGRLEEIRSALPAFRIPTITPLKTLEHNIFHATPPSQRIKLLRKVHCAAELDPLANGPVVFDVRLIVDLNS
jgi:hypothetical protein